MKKKEPKELSNFIGPTTGTTSNSKSFPPIPGVVGMSLSGWSPPDPTIEGYGGFLLWMREESWTSHQAILIYLSVDPGKIPPGYTKDLGRYGHARKLLATFPGIINKIRDFQNFHRLVQKDIQRGKVDESMSPDRWIEWFISLDFSINFLLFKAYKASYPNSSWEPRSQLNGYVANFERIIPAKCSSCIEKDAEIQRLKKEVGNLRKEGNGSKMQKVLASLILVCYGEKTKEVTQDMINDLERVGCSIADDTLRKYFREGRESLEKSPS